MNSSEETNDAHYWEPSGGGAEQEDIREAGKATDGKSSKASSSNFIPGLMGSHGRVSGKKKTRI